MKENIIAPRDNEITVQKNCTDDPADSALDKAEWPRLPLRVTIRSR